MTSVGCFDLSKIYFMSWNILEARRVKRNVGLESARRCLVAKTKCLSWPRFGWLDPFIGV